MTWFASYVPRAAETDRFKEHEDHVSLLAAGLLGETGSMLAELKKEKRELEAYPAYRERMLEEAGDFLWYFTRLISKVEPSLIDMLDKSKADSKTKDKETLQCFVALGAATGELIGVINDVSRRRDAFVKVWDLLNRACIDVSVNLQEAAERNLKKTHSRWPEECIYHPLFDNDCLEEEKLPRALEVEFRERPQGSKKSLVLRCNGLNLGDRLTDNIEDPDGYRYHDIFHFAYAVHVGWSPVMRALLKCKRKQDERTDEEQDGARAAILEEAVSAIVFSRAKRLNYFDGIGHLDYDLLKTVSEFVEGYEVEAVPLWQWEKAILEGFRVFRKLKINQGGTVRLDLTNRELSYIAPVRS